MSEHTVPPIPKAAMSVVRKLRKDVPRPDVPHRSGWSLRWKVDRWPIPACPMGLHPDSASNIGPIGNRGGYSNSERAFYRWWDDTAPTAENAVAARDMIWTEEAE